MDILGIAALPVICVICYGVAEVIKATALDNKWLPPICIILGGILGAVTFYVATDSIPASDVFMAVAIGIVSGGFATTIHQTWKQQLSDEYVGKH